MFTVSAAKKGLIFKFPMGYKYTTIGNKNEMKIISWCWWVHNVLKKLL